MSSKIQDVTQIAAAIRDHSVLLFTSDASLMVCDELLAAIEKRFLETSHPRNVTIVQPCNGFLGVGTGIDRLMHKGLARTLITSILPADRRSKTHALLEARDVDVVLLPMGVMYAWLRENGAGRPGLFSRSGLGTFVEEYINRKFIIGNAAQTLVKAVELDGNRYLHYQPIKIDFSFVRATSADSRGNLSFEREPLILDPLAVALNGKSASGKCYAQAERVVAEAYRAPRSIRVPGFLIDGFCITPDASHSINKAYNAAYTNEVRSVEHHGSQLSLDKEIAVRRAIKEIGDGDVVNLGVGAGAYVPSIMSQFPDAPACTFITEHGSIGGTPVSDVNFFGVHLNAESIINPSEMFAIYSAGLLDVSILGFAQADETGNVNVSRLGHRSNGAGGFIDISHNAKKIIFCGTFSTGGLKIDLQKTKLKIRSEGQIRKFVDSVDEVTFSYDNVRRENADIYFMTERCVLKISKGVYHLAEIAPGICPREDVIKQLPFHVTVGDKIPEMDLEKLGIVSRD